MVRARGGGGSGGGGYCAYPAVAYIMWLLLLNMVTLALELSVVTYAT